MNATQTQPIPIHDYEAPEPDAYDDAVAYLTEHPEEIIRAWRSPQTHPGGALFAFVGNSCGCLSMIRGSDGYVATTAELTLAIRSDERIPSDPDCITVNHLPIFAGWQRRIDRELGRTPPERMKV